MTRPVRNEMVEVSTVHLNLMMCHLASGSTTAYHSLTRHEKHACATSLTWARFGLASRFLKDPPSKISDLSDCYEKSYKFLGGENRA